MVAGGNLVVVDDDPALVFVEDADGVGLVSDSAELASATALIPSASATRNSPRPSARLIVPGAPPVSLRVTNQTVRRITSTTAQTIKIKPTPIEAPIIVAP